MAFVSTVCMLHDSTVVEFVRLQDQGMVSEHYYRTEASRRHRLFPRLAFDVPGGHGDRLPETWPRRGPLCAALTGGALKPPNLSTLYAAHGLYPYMTLMMLRQQELQGQRAEALAEELAGARQAVHRLEAESEGWRSQLQNLGAAMQELSRARQDQATQQEVVSRELADA